jgi:putative ATP-binding cassette transporter
MNKAGIGYLNERLLNEENWSVALSLGEQQKISILRSILARPNIIIMDEATSAITESDEQRIFGLLKEELSNITLISVGHRATLRQFHNHEIKLS